MEGAYKRYMHENADDIKKMKTAEDTFITPYQRGLEDYFELIEKSVSEDMSLRKYISDCNNKITYMDLGCGEGNAIKDLLCIGSDKLVVEKCIGVSMHLFQNMYSLLEKNKERLELFRGDIFDIIPTLPSNSVDLITDIFGPYHYSPNKHILLPEYYRILKPGGKCYLVGVNAKSIVGKGEYIIAGLEKFMSKDYPEIFYISDDCIVMIVTKRANEFPNFKLSIVNYENIEKRDRNGRTYEQMVEGCAVAPYYSRFESR